ncbi:uncharacterized protein LOC115574552 isoform X2 [Sparus aurata]|nr:uncharacterized protein LOC115574552 isoform X2 [Sparus aurata]
MLTCTVLSYSGCGYTVQWLYDDNMDGVETVQLRCSARVTYKPPHLNNKSNYHKLPECEVTDDQSGQTLLWKVNSGSKTSSAEDDTPPQLGVHPWFGKCTAYFLEENSSSLLNLQDVEVRWRFIIVSVVLSALLISVVTVNMWTRTKGNKTQREENREHDDEDEDEGTVVYENTGEPSASVRLH